MRLLCWDKGGAGNVAEGDVGGHLQGHTSGKGTDLFMYVHEKGVRAPAAHLFDGVGVDAVQVHGHGAASTKGVAADVLGGVAELIEAKVLGDLFDGGVDVGGRHLKQSSGEGVVVGEDAGSGWAMVTEDVMDPAGKGFDGAVGGAGAFLVDALAFDAILLVG